MAILDKSSPYYQSAFRLCNYMRLTCELLAETEDLIMAARLHRLLLLRSTFQKIQEGRAELRDVLEARILAMNPKFHLFTSMAITEALAEYEKRSNSED